MTIEEKVAAYEMLLRGATLQECADRFGVTRERIRQITPPKGAKTYGKRRYEKCIYPNIASWLIKNKYCYSRFAEAIGATSMTAQRWLTGKASPSKKSIDRILEVTGMTYEEAFCEKKKAAPRAGTSEEGAD